MGISTHILDTTRGKPAAGVTVVLEESNQEGWKKVNAGVTDADGRVKGLMVESPAVGTYRITFAVGAYFQAQNVKSFYPEVSIVFLVGEEGQHYHVPLLLNPFGFSTYRGS